METITQLISNVGFPIACCIGMFWYINNTQKETNQLLTNLNETMTKIVDRLDNEKEEKQQTVPHRKKSFLIQFFLWGTTLLIKGAIL